MAMIIKPSFDVSTPEKMARFIHTFETAYPNAKKSVHEIRPNDIIYVDNHPCMMSNPPKVSYVDSLSGPGYEDPEEEKVVLVRGRSVIDGKEYGHLYSYPFKAERFVDKHDEREWLVKRREGMRLYLQSPRDPSDTWVMYMQPEKVTPCFWLLARGLPGKVYFRIYRQMGLNVITGARDAPGFSA